MSEWLPRFACPACQAAVDRSGDRLSCGACVRTFDRRDGIWRLLLAERHAAIDPFLRQYRVIRERDGYRSATASYYRDLPSVPDDDPEAAAWRVRRQSHRTFERRVLQQWSSRSIAALDLGAGNGWLSGRLAERGHHAVAIDWLDDDRDGLGARRHYDAPFVCVQADFDALPFEPAQFDLVVFNGSLHYSPNVRATLGHARRLLAPGGTLAVVDSPLFWRMPDGRAMVAEKTQRFLGEYGLNGVVTSGVGFVTFADLGSAAAELRLRGDFYHSRGPLGWRMRRAAGGLRRGRMPAAFGVWVAR